MQKKKEEDPIDVELKESTVLRSHYLSILTSNYTSTIVV